MAIRRRTGIRGSDKGVAVIMVVLVLAGLIAIVGPFSLSMFLHERKARHFRDGVRSRLAAEGAVAHAVSILKRTGDEAEKSRNAVAPWNTPDYDTAAEFDVRFDEIAARVGGMGMSFDDPRGTIWSVRVEDEQAKINLTASPPHFIGNLIGSASLTTRLMPGESSAEVDDASFFISDDDPGTIDGSVSIGIREGQYSYTEASGTSLDGLQWVRSDIEPSSAPYPVGALVYDTAAWSIHGAAQQDKLGSIENVRAILRPDDFERIRPYITLHSHRDSGTGWFRREVVLWGIGHNSDLITVNDAEGLGPGTTVRFVLDGVVRASNYRVISAHKRNADLWVLRMNRVLFDKPQDVDVVEVEGQQRHPININTASRPVLAACFTGVKLSGRGFVTRAEAESMGEFVHGYVRSDDFGRPCASIGDVKAMFKAYRALEDASWIPVSKKKIEALTENAIVMNSPRLAVSTTTFCFKSYGDFTIEAAGVVNTLAGGESSRHMIRQMLRMPVNAGGRWVLSSQAEFDEQVGRTVGRKVVTWPFLEPPTDEDDLERYTEGLDLKTGKDPEGYVTLGTGKVAELPPNTKGMVADHFDVRSKVWRGLGGGYERNHDGAVLTGGIWAEGKHLFTPGNVRGDCMPFQLEFWMKGVGGNVFIAGDADERNGIRLTYVTAPETGFTLVVADASAVDPDGKMPWLGPAEFFFPCDRLEPSDWYHISFQVSGTGPEDASVWIDGFPLGVDVQGIDAMKYVKGTKLSGDLPAPADYVDEMYKATVYVDSNRNFPKKGAILIDGEVIEYDNTNNNGTSTFENCRRGRRHTRGPEQAVNSGGVSKAAERWVHAGGVATVTPYGYSNGLVDELYKGYGLLEHMVRSPAPESRMKDDGTGRFGALESEMELDDASQFPNHGMVVVMWRETIRKNSAGEWYTSDGGRDARRYAFRYYEGKQGNRLTGLSARQFDYGSSMYPFFFCPKDYEFKTDEVQPSERPLVRLISIAIKGSPQNPDFPQKLMSIAQPPRWANHNHGRNYTFSQYVCVRDDSDDQIEYVEWIRLEKVLSHNGHYYLVGWKYHRTEPERPWRWVDASQGPRTKYDTWRGQLGTERYPLLTPASARLLPVVRMKGPQCGDQDSGHTKDAFEEVTVVSGAGYESDTRGISHAHCLELTWATPVPPEGTGPFPYGHTQVYRMSLDEYMEKGHPANTGRVLKFPSGEMPRAVPQRMVLGPNSRAIDEIKARVLDRDRDAVVAFETLLEPAQQVTLTADQITIMADLFRYSENVPGGGAHIATSAPTHGVVKIDDELIYFTGVNNNAGDIALPWGRHENRLWYDTSKNPQRWKFKHCPYETNGKGEDGHDHYGDDGSCLAGCKHYMKRMTLTGCVRGILGSDAQNHAPGAAVSFLEFYPLTRLTDALPPEGDMLRVRNDDRYMFGLEGFALVSSEREKARPYVGEIVGWTKANLTGCQYFRGRYGTSTYLGDDHRAGDFCLVMPFRYWDRYAKESADSAETAYFSASYSARGAEWHSIEYKESGFGGRSSLANIELRVRVRFDGKPAWTERPTNKPGGIWEFSGDGLHSFHSAGGGQLTADSIDVRVYFVYKRGAYGDMTNDWKRNVRMDHMIVTFGNPLVVRKVDLLDY